MSAGRKRGGAGVVRPWAAFCVVLGGYFLAQMDMTVLAVALPRIRAELGASVVAGSWAVSAYATALAAGLITAGRLGDLFGSRRVFAWGVALFTLCSLACGLAQSPGWLIAARAAQGAGATLLVPQILSTIVAVIPEGRRGLALGVRGSVGAGAAVVGPLVGGLLVGLLDWRWVFFVNVPIGLVLFVAALLVLPPTSRTRRRLDVPGAGLAAAALLAAVTTLTRTGESGWTVWSGVGAGLAVLLIAGLVFQQRRAQQAEPLIPFAVFRSRGYRLMLPVGVSVSAAVIGFTLVLSFFLQEGLGAGPVQAGLVLAPASLSSMLLAPLVGRLVDRTDARGLLAAGLLLTACGVGLSAQLMTPDARWEGFLPAMLLVGAGNALLFTPMAAIAMRGVAGPVAGAASGVLATFLQFGSVLGTAAVAVVMQHLARDTGFAQASRSAMLVPLAALAVAAVSCALTERTPPRAGRSGASGASPASTTPEPGAPDT